jgi:hypothetical protein
MVVACTLTAPPAPSATPTQAATVAPIASPTVARLLASANAPADQFSSFRMRIERTWTPDGTASPSERIVWLNEKTSTPPAQRLVIASSDSDASWLQLGNLAWECSKSEAVCSSSAISETRVIANVFNQVLLNGPEPILVLANQDDYTWLGMQTAGDIPVRHYQVQFLPLAKSVHPGETESVTSADAQVWVTESDQLPPYVLRMLITWRGERQGIPGTGMLSYELFDVNAPFAIEMPDSIAIDLLNQVPLPEGTLNLEKTPYSISFTTLQETTTVAEFFRNTLPSAGFISISESEQEGAIFSEQIWTKNGFLYIIGIGKAETDSENGESLVTINQQKP